MFVTIIGAFALWAAVIIGIMAHIRIGVLQEEIERLREAVQPPMHPFRKPYAWDVIDG